MRKTTGKKAQPVERLLVHGSRHIPYRLHLRKRRGLRISVTPDLTVNVFAPSRASRNWVEDTLREKASWITRTLDRIASCQILCFPDRFEVGSLLPYLGREHRLAIIRGDPVSSELLFDTLVVTVPNPDSSAGVTRAVKHWYRSRAETEFRESVERCFPRVEPHRARMSKWTIRNMRSRWGSCSSAGSVILNLKLVMLPEPLIDYVVMHELCHLVHHDHSKRFYGLLTECMPDWKERKESLERYRMK